MSSMLVIVFLTRGHHKQKYTYRTTLLISVNNFEPVERSSQLCTFML